MSVAPSQFGKGQADEPVAPAKSGKKNKKNKSSRDRGQSGGSEKAPENHDETLPLTNGAEDDSESQWTGISIGENADERDEEPGNGQNCNASEAAKDQSKDGPTKNAASKQISERMTEMFSNDELQMNMSRLITSLLINLSSPLSLLLVYFYVTLATCWHLWWEKKEPGQHAGRGDLATSDAGNAFEDSEAPGRGTQISVLGLHAKEGDVEGGESPGMSLVEHTNKPRTRSSFSHAPQLKKQRSSLLVDQNFRKVWEKKLSRFSVHESAARDFFYWTSCVLNMGLLAWCFSNDFRRVPLTEVFLPRWLMVGVILSRATKSVLKSYDSIDTRSEIRGAVQERIADRYQQAYKKWEKRNNQGWKLWEEASPEKKKIEKLKLSPKFQTVQPNFFSCNFSFSINMIAPDKPEYDSEQKEANPPVELCNYIDSCRDLICPQLLSRTPLKFPVRMWRQWQIRRGIEKLGDTSKDAAEWSKTVFDLTQLDIGLTECAHESLFKKHFDRIMQFEEVKLFLSYPEPKEKEEKEKIDQHLAAYRISFKYARALHKGAVPLPVLMDEVLIGGIVRTEWIILKCMVYAVGIFLITTAALIPAMTRDGSDSSKNRSPQNFGGYIVAACFIVFVFLNGFLMAVWYPTQLRNLFSQMTSGFRMFNVMLMGKKAATAECLPHVRVGDRKQMFSWYLLYSFFISSIQRRKLALEVGFGHGVVNVLLMCLFLFLDLLKIGPNWVDVEDSRNSTANRHLQGGTKPHDRHDNDEANWLPGVLFGETLIFMMLFLIFSLPPLLVGLRANQNNRRTVDLLWGHATESRAYLCRLEAERAWWDQDIKDVKASIELTESIAQRHSMQCFFLRPAGSKETTTSR
ncbi:unnamed protein product [Durusdinium trenchii]|uniref:Uncharacterized protein n=1 Tax=Durusdinium trenchii TaxID=1381693 RepID=A0ABP0QE47_9DINO